MTPAYYSNHAKKWMLPATEAQLKQLDETIPGLYVNYVAGKASGSIDAVAAGCYALGLPPPTQDVQGMASVEKRTDLRQYQKEAVETVGSMLVQFGAAILADDMGLGKTRETIATLQEMGAYPVVVVCPASVRETWRKELQTCGVKAKRISVFGPPSDKAYEPDRKKLLSAEWVITSYELLPVVLASERFQYRPPTALVIDEWHMVKGRKTKRSQAMEDAAAMVPYKIAVTGTPFDNMPRDLWRALRIILGGNRFGNQWAFDKRYCAGQPGEHGGWDNKGATNLHELKLRLSYYMVRREKKDVASELPKVTRQVQLVDPDDAARQAWQTACVRKSAGDFSAAMIASLACKIPAAIETCLAASQRPGKKFLCFTWTKDHAARIGAELKKQGADNYVITGDLSTQKRNALVAEAAKRKIGIVATIDSCGTGVDGIQHVASTCVMHYVHQRPMVNAQAEARLDRIGQDEPVQVIYLGCRGMEELHLRNTIRKLDAFRMVVGSDAATKVRDELTAAMDNQDDSGYLRRLVEQMKEEEDEDEDD